MAENPKQRFRRVLNDLSQDDRTFLDSGLRRIYSESLSYGLKNNFLSKEEVVKYQTLAQQRDTALRKVNVLDPQGNPISKETTVPVMRNGQVVQEKRVTPVTPFDLLRKTGGQMDGGSVEGPLFTGYTLDTGAPIGTARKKFQEEVIPAAQKAARELERTQGQTAMSNPLTGAALTAGAIYGAGRGLYKTAITPAATGVARGIGLVNPEAGRLMQEGIARDFYPQATIDVSKPFQTGADVAEIAGATYAENVVPGIAGTVIGGAVAAPATLATTPVGGAIAGVGAGLAAAAGTRQAQNFLAELAMGSSYKPSETGVGFDIERSPVSEARARFMQERTELAPSAAYAGELATNFTLATPNLPTGFFGGLKSGLAATKLGPVARQSLANAAIPTEGLAGKVAATPFMQGARTLGKNLEKIPGVETAATFGRGFAASVPGREFLSDVTERGVEASSDLAMALQDNANRPPEERDPLWMILGKTALGGMFEGQHKLGRFLNAPGQRLGQAITRGLDTKFGTYTPSAYEPINVPSPFARTPKTPTTGTVTPGGPSPVSATQGMQPTFAQARNQPSPAGRNPLGENVVPIGGGRVVTINPADMSATISNAPSFESDRMGAENPLVGQSLLNAVSSLAPKKGYSFAGNYAKAASTFGKVQTRGDESQTFLGMTHDGLAMVKSTNRKTGDSSIDLVSQDMLFGDNQKLAAQAIKIGGLTPSDKSGYQLKNYEYDLSRAADYVPSKDGEGPSDVDFNRRIDVVGTPLYGRVVKAIDKNYSVVQLPSPVGGFDMMVVPNDTVEGLSRDVVATNAEGEVLDTTSMVSDPSAFRVDRGKYDPIFRLSDRERFTGEVHPVLLTPEQAADARNRRDTLNNYRNQMRSEGIPGGVAKTRLSTASKNTRKEFNKSFTKSNADYTVGSVVEFKTPDGGVDNGVVVGNTQYGPTVVSTSNPMSPAVTVQESAITRRYSATTPKEQPTTGRTRPTAPEATATTTPTPTPTQTEEPTARRTPRRTTPEATTSEVAADTAVEPEVVQERRRRRDTGRQRRRATEQPVSETPTATTRVTPEAVTPIVEATPVVTPTEAPVTSSRRRRRQAPVDFIADETPAEAREREAIARASEFDFAPDVVAEPTIISEADLMGEPDVLPSEEGSALDVTMPGDIEILDDDSLVRITASIEGLGDINDVFRKARNVNELKAILKQVVQDANVNMSEAEADKYADSVAKYYDEWMRAFVNRDLLIAQQYAQGVREFASTVTSGSNVKYSVEEVPILDTDTKQAAKQKRVRNRIARLYQKFDIPRVTNIIDMLNEEASKKVLVRNADGTYSPDGRIMYFGDTLSLDQKREVVRKVQTKLIQQRYQTNVPVFAVLAKAPNISAAFDDVFVGEGAYVNIRNSANDVGQQVVFVTMNQADAGTIIEELSHAILENMPIDMAREVATKLGKTLREPTTTNESVASYELQEMFAARMRMSFLNGENAFLESTGSREAKARMTELWSNIRTFMQRAYSEMSSSITTPRVEGEYDAQWSVPYDWKRISLWDYAPVIIDVNGVPVRGKILPTKKFPYGPQMVAERNLDKPIVAVELYNEDGTVTTDMVTPRDVIALSDDIGMSPEFGKMLLNFVSGSSGQRNIQVVGLDNPYNAVSEAITENSYAGMKDRLTKFNDNTLKPYLRKIASNKPEDVERAADNLKGIVPNKLLTIVNQANEYGLLSDVPTNSDDSLSLQNWLNVIGTMKDGEGRTREAFTKQGNRKLTAEKWMQRSLPDLQRAIEEASPYAPALEAQSRNQRQSYNVDAGNTGGNVLYSSRKNRFATQADRALADGQASTRNPDARTPVDFAEYATRNGLPRESVTPIVQQRIDSDVLRSGLNNSNIRLMELNDVLVIDGTIGINESGIDTIGKAIDFAVRNNIPEALLVTKASPNEEIGYNDKRGYSVEPSVTFEFDGPVAENVYATMKRIYPYVRKSIDGQSVTLHNVDQRGKKYEASLATFEQAVSKIASELTKRGIPVQAVQDTERVWHFGNEAAKGYTIPFYEARNVLHLIKPEIYETGHQLVTDQRLKDVIDRSLSSVAGREINIPGDWSYAQDNAERRIGIGSNYDKLPTNSYSTNPETKVAYDALMSELDRQFKYLNMQVGDVTSSTPATTKIVRSPATKGHPLMANSKQVDVDGKPLRYIDVLDAIHSSISDAVDIASAGEHSDLASFAAHSAITKDVNAVRALYTETLGRSNYKTLGGRDVHKAAIAPIEDMKTGIVTLDKRVQKMYDTNKAPYGDLKPNQVTNPMGRVQFASGGGTPLYSLRPLSEVKAEKPGESIPSEESPVTFADEDGVETTFVDPAEYSTFMKTVQKIDESWIMRGFDVFNALGRLPMAGDWSAPLIQNWMLANPIESPDLFFKSLLFGPKSLAPNLGIDNGVGTINKKAFKGREQVHRMGNEMRSNKYYQLAKDSRLTLATSQYDRILEQLQTERENKLAEMRKTDPEATLPEIDLMDVNELDVDPDIQGLLSGERYIPGKASSERAMTMMKDYVKFNKFVQAMATYEELGYDPSSAGFKEAAADMAAILNVSNGDIKFSAQEYDKAIGRMMRRVMFAPRWLTSRVMADPLGRWALSQTEVGKKWMEVNGIPTTRSLNPYVYRANMKMLLKARALWYALLAYFGLYRPFDRFQVKTSVGNLGTKVQVGNYVFRAPGGSMMFLEFADSFFGAMKMSPKDSPEDARSKFSKMMGSFVLGRIINAPAISMMTEMFTGRDFMGKPIGYVDEDLKAWYDDVTKPMLQQVGIDAPEMKLSRFVTKNLLFLWIQSYLETYKMARDREEEDKGFEAAFVGAMNALGGRVRYNPPSGPGEYNYDSYGNPPTAQNYLLGIDKEEWLMNPASDLRPDQMEQIEEEVIE